MSDKTSVDVTAAIDRSGISRFQWLVIVLCAVVAILDGFDTQAIAFVAPVIAADWGIDKSIFGPVFGAGLFGLMIGALVLGPVADRIGRKTVIIVSTLVFGLFSLLTVTASSVEMLLVLRFLTGLGLGGAMPNIIAMTSEYAPRRMQSTLVTVMFCGFPLGAVIGGAISSQLIPAFGWTSVFYLGGVMPLLLVPVLIAWMPESIRFLVQRANAGDKVARILGRIDGGSYAPDQTFSLPEAALQGMPVRHLFTDRRALGTMLLWVAFFMNLLILYFLINWLPTVMEAAGLPLEQAIIATVLLNLGGIVGGITLGRVIDRIGHYRVLAAAYFMAAVFVAGIGQATASIALALAVVFVAGFCVIGAQFGANALAAQFYPTSVRSTGIGWALGIGRIGSIIGPVIGGLMIGLAWGVEGLFVAAALPALVAAVAITVMGVSMSPKRIVAVTPAE